MAAKASWHRNYVTVTLCIYGSGRRGRLRTDLDNVRGSGGRALWLYGRATAGPRDRVTSSAG